MSEGGVGVALAPLDFEMISKSSFFQFRWVKNKFHHFWTPPGNNFGKVPYCPPSECVTESEWVIGTIANSNLLQIS